jgi:hypothetical protein
MAENSIENDPLRPTSKVERQLRRLLCVALCGFGAYMDDGEASDCSVQPAIDFLRDTPEEIERKVRERNFARMDKEAQDEANRQPT